MWHWKLFDSTLTSLSSNPRKLGSYSCSGVHGSPTPVVLAGRLREERDAGSRQRGRRPGSLGSSCGPNESSCGRASGGGLDLALIERDCRRSCRNAQDGSVSREARVKRVPMAARARSRGRRRSSEWPVAPVHPRLAWLARRSLVERRSTSDPRRSQDASRAQSALKSP